MRRLDFDRHPIDLDAVRRVARASDHAVLRFLEREIGVDIDDVRRRLLSDAVLQAMALNAPTVKTATSRLVLKDFTIVTVLPLGKDGAR